ncbi:hypothetical protein Hypma_013028 [Hypsizygus marmoreus]|uniref:Uncharacterized protein n=1 Tax=Hypsizygus marmoreus TaxID=39966 RepID=A0A369JD57_HYPMA|nr:hypothetical protein Hypma_013028 [Hypsizygus marmoreus]
MSGARLSTVYDFSSLRLHPDGSRVNQTSRNLRPRNARLSVQDSRGNWFARDAAGLGTVGRYRRVRDEDNDEEPDGEEASAGPSRRRKGKRKAKTTTGKRRTDNRPEKRQKFYDNLDFLNAPTLNTPTGSDFPLPSSDLLKSIHYFASSYYHERGQLFNATKEYRAMRKRNTQMRLEQQREAQEAREAGVPEEDIPVVRKGRGGRVKGRGKRVYPKDMYKVLDGSALIAIGMLVQEKIDRLLEVRIPDGWGEMVQQAYGSEAAEDDDILEEDGDNPGEDEPGEELEGADNEDEDPIEAVQDIGDIDQEQIEPEDDLEEESDE